MTPPPPSHDAERRHSGVPGLVDEPRAAVRAPSAGRFSTGGAHDRVGPRLRAAAVVRGCWKDGSVAEDTRPDLGFDDQVIVDLVPMVRKIVGSRIHDPHVVDDLVQETLVRVMAAHSRVEGDTVAPYAAVTARNVVASFARRNDRARDRAHLLAGADEDLFERPGESLLRREEGSVVAAALSRLPSAERDMLVAHEVLGHDTKTLARLLEAFRDTPFKLCATATPAPNDWTELGTHAEFLGVCTRQEMLAEYFVHDGGETQVWRLKGHAREAFWRWVAGWGAMRREDHRPVRRFGRARELRHACILPKISTT